MNYAHVPPRSPLMMTTTTTTVKARAKAKAKPCCHVNWPPRENVMIKLQ